MPYIKSDDRFKFNLGLFELPNCKTPGELNYLMTRICQDYLKEVGKSYTSMNAVIGVLECVKHEFQRRLLDPYEDGKIKENGDVY